MPISNVTSALHARVDISTAGAVVTPLFQNSAFSSDSKYFYTRKDNPNTQELELVISTFEDASYCVAYSTGMAAIAAALSLVPIGGTVLLNKYVYGCTHRMLDRLANRGVIKLMVADLSKPDLVDLQEPIDMVLFETPTNPFLKHVDISVISEKVKRNSRNALVVVDNTWATPLFQHPLKHGADISLLSATKFLSGHSDVMGGAVLTNSEELNEELRAYRFYHGAVLDPHSAWLLRRSAQTLPLRMHSHSQVTKEMCQFLESQKPVERVYYPIVDEHQLKDYGGIVFFQLAAEFCDSYEVFRNALRLFNTGTGMAAVTSMVAQPYTGSHASMNDNEKQEIGLNRGLVRLCFGLETIDDLKRDLAKSFQELTNCFVSSLKDKY